MTKSRETLASGDPSANATSPFVWTTWAIALLAAISFTLFAIAFLKIYEHDNHLRKREAEIRGQEMLTEQHTREVTALHEDIGKLQAKRGGLRDEVNSLEEETAKLKEKEGGAKERLERLEEREGSLRSELDKVQGRRDELAKEARQFREERERLSEQRENLETAIKTLEEKETVPYTL